jgi:hypothetical protein
MEIDEKKLWAECGRHRWRWSKKNGNTWNNGSQCHSTNPLSLRGVWASMLWRKI